MANYVKFVSSWGSALDHMNEYTKQQVHSIVDSNINICISVKKVFASFVFINSQIFIGFLCRKVWSVLVFSSSFAYALCVKKLTYRCMISSKSSAQ